VRIYERFICVFLVVYNVLCMEILYTTETLDETVAKSLLAEKLLAKFLGHLQMNEVVIRMFVDVTTLDVTCST